MSQIHLQSFIRIEFSFKQDSYLWEIQAMGKNYNTVPFSMKSNIIQKSKWEFSMLAESYKLSKCSFLSDSGSGRIYFFS